jgi:hypothetical protein
MASQLSDRELEICSKQWGTKDLLQIAKIDASFNREQRVKACGDLKDQFDTDNGMHQAEYGDLLDGLSMIAEKIFNILVDDWENYLKLASDAPSPKQLPASTPLFSVANLKG